MIRLLNFVVLGLLCASGCSEYTISQASKEIEPVSALPEIDVVPLFSDLGVGDGTINEQLRSVIFISNIGDADLMVDDVYIDPPFIKSGWDSINIEPGQTAELTLSYIAIGDVTSIGHLSIYSNDYDESVVDVALAANAIAPILYLEPSEIDFEEVGITCSESAFFTIGNIGRAPLEIEEISDTLVENFYTELPVVPFIIDSNDTVEAGIIFSPTEPISHIGDIAITSNAWNIRHAEIDVIGTGVWGPEVIDIFQQLEVINADILFTIDNSCSMLDEQLNLASNAGLFMSSLDSTGVDYQVGVITTDRPSFVSPIITPATLDPVTEFENAVIVGTEGDAYEKGLDMSMYSTTSPGDASADAGFIRDSSILGIVVVSDEDDFSLSPVLDYVSHFNGLKLNPDEVAFHSVVDDGTESCGSSTGYRYMDTSVGTGGSIFNLCLGTWGTFLESIVAEATAPVNTFELTEEPVEETIVVTVDGVLEDSWDLYASPARVVFWQNSIPPSLSEVIVTYNTWPECD